MEKQVTRTPPIPGNGGGGFWLSVFSLLTTCDREPAINVDMVNISYFVLAKIASGSSMPECPGPFENYKILHTCLKNFGKRDYSRFL